MCRFLILLPLLLLLSCDSSDPDLKDFSHIAEAAERWQAYEFESYAIDQTIQCFCPPPQTFTLHVEADSIVGIDLNMSAFELWDLSEEQLQEYAQQRSFTVNDVFALIAENLESAHQLDVTYDPTYGYPTEVYLDKAANIADEEIRIKMSNLSF